MGLQQHPGPIVPVDQEGFFFFEHKHKKIQPLNTKAGLLCADLQKSCFGLQHQKKKKKKSLITHICSCKYIANSGNIAEFFKNTCLEHSSS